MKITVIGATGQIGSQVVSILTSAGHEVVGASRSTGVDVLTGAGLADALAGADVAVDVTNSPSFDDEPVLSFFTAESTNVAAAAAEAGVKHVVVLSIVGADRLPDSGYMRAKVAQEKVIAESGLPYTIVRATQFHEFAEAILGSLLVDGTVHVPDARIQPIAAAEVAAVVAETAQGTPANGAFDLGGPEKLSFAQLARIMGESGVDAPIVIDGAATYFGASVDQNSLVTGEGGVLGDLTLREWVKAKRAV